MVPVELILGPVVFFHSHFNLSLFWSRSAFWSQSCGLGLGPGSGIVLVLILMPVELIFCPVVFFSQLFQSWSFFGLGHDVSLFSILVLILIQVSVSVLVSSLVSGPLLQARGMNAVEV